MNPIRLLTVGMVLILTLHVFPTGVDAQSGGGAADYDYFNPNNDSHVKWLIDDVNRAHTQVALRAFAQGDYQRTQVELNYTLGVFVNHPQALALANMLSISAKRSAWAMPYFEKALRMYPQYALTHAQYGKYLTEIGSLENGIAKLKQAADMDAKLVAAHVWLAAAYTKSGKPDLAREAAEMAKTLGYKGDLK